MKSTIKKTICEVKIITNKINQSFNYMIDLSLYNSIKYGDLVLVKFNNNYNIGFVLDVIESDENPKYKLNKILKVLKYNNVSEYSYNISDYLSNMTLNKREDVLSLVVSKNEVSKNKLAIKFLKNIEVLKEEIETLYTDCGKKVELTNNEISDGFNKINCEKINFVKFFDEDFIQRDMIPFSKIKKEYKVLIDLMYENKLIDFILWQDKIKTIKAYSLDNLKFYKKKDFIQLNKISEYNFNKKRKAKEIFERSLEEREIESIEEYSLRTLSLTTYQEEKLENIKKNIVNSPILLRGITGSGKTSVYIKLIEEYFKKGKSILFLVPEITLVKQIILDLKESFGEECGFYYGDMTSTQKSNFLSKLKNGRIKIVIGTRSSIFLEIPNLSLVIIDEEHDSSYKQNFYPYYSVHDFVSFWTSQNIDVLLGSATPSILSYTKAKREVYKLVEMTKRYNDYSNANIIFEEYDRNDLLSKKFIKYIKNSLEKREKVLVFFNVKGYSKIVECDNCKDVPVCPNCNIPLKFYKSNSTLECSYCKYEIKRYTTCNKCGTKKLNYVGQGIEMVEDELNKYFNGKVLRIDSKVAKTKIKVQEIIEDFNNSDDKILVGTQIISKGLNFNKLNKVIILNLDNMLYFNDFSAYEQTYQLLEQVSGRSGREKEDGEVIIFTNHQDNYVFKSVKKHDYEMFYKEEMLNRKLQRSLPYYYVCQIEIRHKSEEVCKSVLEIIKKELEEDNFLVTEVVKPYIIKIKDQYRYKIYVKYKRENLKNIIENILKRNRLSKENLFVDLMIMSYGY